MAKKIRSLADRFKTFIANLQMENQTFIARRFKEIARRVNDDFWNLKSDQRNTHYIGSYGRGTAIKGTSNINILVILPPAVFEHFDNFKGNGQFTLLTELRASMLKIYPETIMKENEKGEVLIPFTDMEFEIIPAFVNSKGNYYYPNIEDEGRWNEFNPIKEIDVINSLNYEYNGKIKHLAKMMRAWKYSNSVPISGMLIDTMVMDFMEEWTGNDKSYSYYGNMTLDFLEYLAGKRNEQGHWYAKGSNRELPRTGNFGRKANEAFKKTSEALRLETDGEYIKAGNVWKEIFGDNFPV